MGRTITKWPINVAAALDDAGLSPMAFRVLGHLSRCANRKKSGFPSIATIKETCGGRRETILAAIRELESKGIIETIRRSGTKNSYQLSDKWSGEWSNIPVHQTVLNQSTAISADQVPEPLEASEGDSIKEIKEGDSINTHSVSFSSATSKNGTNPENHEPSQDVRDNHSGHKKSLVRKEKTVPDRFATEADVIRFVFSDTACRELQCLTMDARWFWNCMTEQSWHRDSKEKQPIKDAKATCRKWMAFKSRPSINAFWYKNEEHREKWKQECRLNRDTNQGEFPEVHAPEKTISCITGRLE